MGVGSKSATSRAACTSPEGLNLSGRVGAELYRACGSRDIDILDLLVAVDSVARSNIASQVCLAIALRMEETIVGAAQKADENSDLFVDHLGPLSSKQTAAAKRAAAAASTKLDGKLRSMTFRYILAGRRFFDGVTNFSYTCDASRVGKKSCLVGNLATPANIFMWCPPQVAIPETQI